MMTTNKTTISNSTSRRIAKTILNGFRSYFADYLNLTLGAKARFEKADWLGGQRAHVERLSLYKTKVKQVSSLLPTITNKDITDLELWRQAKTAYTQLVYNFPNFEIAETFFNSVFGDINDHDKINDDLIYVLSSQIKPPLKAEYSIYIRYENLASPRELLRRMLEDAEFSPPFEDLDRDLANIVAEFDQSVVPELESPRHELKFDLLEAVFYRGKAAYLIGRIVDKERYIPFVLPIMNNERGSLFVDTAIFNREEMSIIFSFSLTHFMVDSPYPYQYAHFLKNLLPHKSDYEIYSSLGFPIHAKTEFYREFVGHLRKSGDKFVVAPGTKGMVMSVFTLPSYDVVFKLIKDRFTPPKDVTHEIVKEKYQLVSRHDRAGRMADTQKFVNLTLPLDRFSTELIEELKQVAPSQLDISEADNRVLFKLLYTERKMIPLNIYLQDADAEQIDNAMEEYGNAIKQLAAANIFPGDMLLKNFGVTRHGRVVFYDYDEICLLTDCNFRKIPEPQTEEQEMSATPWYSIGPNDVFPEEFSLFFSGNPQARKAFERMHRDLYKVEFWQRIQNRIRKGTVIDVFPYRKNRRFIRRRAMRLARKT